jgi:hypothetical protein
MVKLLIGIVLFVIGLIAAAMGIAGVGTDSSLAIAAMAGLSLAAGGLLIGLSMGNWKQPRTHLEPGDEVVDPEGYHKMKHV